MDFEKIIPIELRQALIVQSGGVQTAPITIERPKWDDMIKNYPNTSIGVDLLYKTIGGGLPKLLADNPGGWQNTCAFRMSRGLNLSKVKLPKDNSKYRAKGSKGGVLKGDDDNYYWYRVSELSKYLSEYLKKPELDITLKKVGLGENKEKVSVDNWKILKKTKGIIMFKVSGWGDASGHFTLWDGKDLIYPGGVEHNDFNNEKYYFHMKYEVYHPIKKKMIVIQTDEIKLWELK